MFSMFPNFLISMFLSLSGGLSVAEVREWSSMGKEETAKFMADCAQLKGEALAKGMRASVSLAKMFTEESRNSTGGDYLPLSVHAKTCLTKGN